MVSSPVNYGYKRNSDRFADMTITKFVRNVALWDFNPQRDDFRYRLPPGRLVFKGDDNTPDEIARGNSMVARGCQMTIMRAVADCYAVDILSTAVEKAKAKGEDKVDLTYYFWTLIKHQPVLRQNIYDFVSQKTRGDWEIRFDIMDIDVDKPIDDSRYLVSPDAEPYSPDNEENDAPADPTD